MSVATAEMEGVGAIAPTLLIPDPVPVCETWEEFFAQCEEVED